MQLGNVYESVCIGIGNFQPVGAHEPAFKSE